MANQIYQLVYLSAAAPSLKPGGIEDILSTSRTNNQRDQLTGMLLFRSGLFVQLLEGEKSAVQRLYDEKIKLDSRHHKLELLLEQTVDQRMFPHWAMGHKNIDEIELDFLEQLESWKIKFTQDDPTATIDKPEVISLFKHFQFS